MFWPATLLLPSFSLSPIHSDVRLRRMRFAPNGNLHCKQLATKLPVHAWRRMGKEGMAGTFLSAAFPATHFPARRVPPWRVSEVREQQPAVNTTKFE